MVVGSSPTGPALPTDEGLWSGASRSPSFQSVRQRPRPFFLQPVLGTAAAHSRLRDGSIPSAATNPRSTAQALHAKLSVRIRYGPPAGRRRGRRFPSNGKSLVACALERVFLSAVPPVRRRPRASDTRMVRSLGANERLVQLHPPRLLFVGPRFRGSEHDPAKVVGGGSIPPGGSFGAQPSKPYTHGAGGLVPLALPTGNLVVCSLERRDLFTHTSPSGTSLDSKSGRAAFDSLVACQTPCGVTTAG